MSTLQPSRMQPLWVQNFGAGKRFCQHENEFWARPAGLGRCWPRCLKPKLVGEYAQTLHVLSRRTKNVTAEGSVGVHPSRSSKEPVDDVPPIPRRAPVFPPPVVSMSLGGDRGDVGPLCPGSCAKF